MRVLKQKELVLEEREVLDDWERGRQERMQARRQIRELLERVDTETVEILMQDNSSASRKEVWWTRIPRKLRKMFFSFFSLN
ncbi:MAG TPA: hypothetical protein VJJ73_01690 [Candidatus Paceibacterota bacterium]